MNPRLRRWLVGATIAALLVSLLPGGRAAQATPEGPLGRYIVLLKPGSNGLRTPGLSAQLTRTGAKVQQELSLIDGMSVTMSPTQVMTLQSHPSVAAVVPDRQQVLPPDPYKILGADRQTTVKLAGKATGPAAQVAADPPGASPANPSVSPEAVQLTRSDAAWGLGVTGQGVKVAVIDSGIDYAHPDLAGTALVDGMGRPMAADMTGTDLTDTIGHGTGVASMVAGQGAAVWQLSNPGVPDLYTRISGMAPGVRLMTAKVFDARAPYGGGWDSWIISAIDWSVRNGAQIINMSLGGGNVPQDGVDPLSLAVNAARKRGVLVVVAAGNEGPGTGSVSSPGSASGAFTVGASTQWRAFGEMGFLTTPGQYLSDQVAYFSGAGPTADGRHKPDLVAPGAFGWSAAPTGDSLEGSYVQLFGGTSQASPVTAGVAALVYDAFRQHNGRFPTADEAARLLRSTATDLQLPAYRQGAGRADSLSAVRAALGQESAFLVDQDAINLGVVSGEVSGQVMLRNSANQALDVQVQAVQSQVDSSLTTTQSTTLSGSQRAANLSLTVPAGQDEMTVQAVWQLPSPSPTSERVRLSVFDPQGRFLGYMRPAVAGDAELAHSVELTVPRPVAGTYRVMVDLRNGRAASPAMTVNVRTTYARTAAPAGVRVPSTVHLAPRGTAMLSVLVDTRSQVPGVHSVGLRLTQGQQAMTLPVSYLVAANLAQGGEFSGSFARGYQGSFNNGDWNVIPFQVSGRPGAAVVDLNWQGVNNGVEAYLINPRGDARHVKANVDLLQTGASQTTHTQLVLRDPEVGMWRLVFHAYGFSGQSFSQPYSGHIRLVGALGPSRVDATGPRGQAVTLQVPVTNPGPDPLTVIGYAQAGTNSVQYSAVSGTLSNVPGPDGSVDNVQFLDVQVLPDAQTLGAYLFWDNRSVALALSLYDSVAYTTKQMATGDQGSLATQVRSPVFGSWLASVAFAGQVPSGTQVNYRGAFYTYAPNPINGVTVATTVIPAGQTVNVPVTVQVPSSIYMPVSGYLLLASTEADILARVPFTVRTQ